MSFNHYTDEQVIASIRSRGHTDQLALKWFFEDVKSYAIGVWRKKYRDLSDDNWEDIFTDSSLKLISRVKKGLQLKEGTKLKSYFTMVVEYTVLDHFAQRNKNKTIPVESIERTASEPDVYTFEQTQIADLIQEKLLQITENPQQVSVILLVSKGYKYKEIIQKTGYQSEGACRNAYMKAKKKIINYFLRHPGEGEKLRALIQENHKQ